MVDQEFRRNGVATFLIRTALEDAMNSGCSAFYLPVCGGEYSYKTGLKKKLDLMLISAAQKCADKLKLTCQNALDISEEDKLLAWDYQSNTKKK